MVCAISFFKFSVRFCSFTLTRHIFLQSEVSIVGLKIDQWFDDLRICKDGKIFAMSWETDFFHI